MATQKYQFHADILGNLNIPPINFTQNINVMNSILTDVRKLIDKSDADINRAIGSMNQIFNSIPTINFEKHHNSLMVILRELHGIKDIASASSQISELHDKAVEIAESCGIDTNKLSESANLADNEKPSRKSTSEILMAKIGLILMILDLLISLWSCYRTEVTSTEQSKYQQGQAEYRAERLEYEKDGAESLAKIANAPILQEPVSQAPTGDCDCPMHEQSPSVEQCSPHDVVDTPLETVDTPLDVADADKTETH